MEEVWLAARNILGSIGAVPLMDWIDSHLDIAVAVLILVLWLTLKPKRT